MTIFNMFGCQVLELIIFLVQLIALLYTLRKM